MRNADTFLKIYILNLSQYHKAKPLSLIAISATIYLSVEPDLKVSEEVEELTCPPLSPFPVFEGLTLSQGNQIR